MKTLLKDYAGGLWRRADEHDLLFMAGALSFSVVVCLVPFILIVFSIGGMLFEQAAFAARVDSFIDVMVPYPDTAAFLKGVVASGAEEFREHRTLAGVAGLVGLLFASSALFGTIRSIFQRIAPTVKGRSAVVGKLHDLMMIGLVMTLFLLAAAVVPAVQILEHLAGSAGAVGSALAALAKPYLLDAVSAVTIFLVLFLVHLLVPASKPSKAAAFAAAASTTVLWSIAAWLFGVYIAEIANFTRVYGAYVLGIVVVFWIHYSSVVFILGAEIGDIYRERRAARRGR